MINRPALRVLGTVFWIAAVAGLYAATRAPAIGGAGQSDLSLGDYFAGAVARIEAADLSGQLQIQDPVFFQDDRGEWSQVGYVDSVMPGSPANVTLTWYARDVSPEQCRLVHHHNSGRLDDVVATMLPPEIRSQIKQRMEAAMREHGDELSEAFVPLVEASLRNSLPVIEDEFRRSIERHRPEINQLGQRWNDEVVEERLIPLAQREILPIVRKHGEPTAEQIGRELWDRASLWRFGWRVVYDRSPLPDRNLVQEEWDRFVDQEAIPVFERHMDDIVVTVQRILSDVAANDAVRRELADVAGGLAADPQTRKLVREILKETLVENAKLRSVWSDVWTSDEAQQALEMAGDRLEPVVRQIGDDLFGNEREGINPNFARVLRNQILRKDRSWIVAESVGGAGRDTADAIATIEPARESMPYPIVYLADPDEETSIDRPGSGSIAE